MVEPVVLGTPFYVVCGGGFSEHSNRAINDSLRTLCLPYAQSKCVQQVPCPFQDKS